MTRYLTLAEFLWLAEQVTGIRAEVLAMSSRVDLADSALHAPQASFGGQDFYPELIDKASVLTCHMAWNHPLPDGNKRVSWACLVMFLELNELYFDPDPPNFDAAEEAIFAIAAHDVDEAWFASWLQERIRSQTTSHP